MPPEPQFKNFNEEVHEDVEIKKLDQRKLPEGYEYTGDPNGSYRKVFRVGDKYPSVSANEMYMNKKVDEKGRPELPIGYRYIGDSLVYEIISDK